MKIQGAHYFESLAVDDEIELITAKFLRTIFMREDLFNATNLLLKEVMIYTIKQKESKEIIANFLSEVWADQDLRWRIVKKTINLKNISPTDVLIFESKTRPTSIMEKIEKKENQNQTQSKG
eukprot:CAMPEP_0170518984 /NCGR_PEP_ID=MMETSP0209-20121228/4546_1 /TAXON_ID=665100 ORGANISM="Litonotus pictus, Strain P1" /NCGR_SAMPLE_ID=MMETSP0209 /ASSEMBLY_ACC=CAM_ASM_000301 /LENGTH=121 /DNA_ID=CAMNT_0010804741 /DNA_START=756 /DNA_END=1124 /DNA_ORIENTATION=+